MRGLRVKHKFSAIIIGVLVSVLLCDYVYAATCDDMRDLVGHARMNDSALNSDIVNVIKNYSDIELYNLTAEKLNSSSVELYKDDAERIATIAKVTQAESEFVEAFITNRPTKEVFESKSNYENLLIDLDEFRNAGYDINVGYLNNIWEQNFMFAQSILKNQKDNTDIGVVGAGMVSPVGNSWILYSPFGTRKDLLTNSKIEFNSGIDFSCKNQQGVTSQWNGVVISVRSTKNMGNIVSIQHGTSVQTVYAKLGKVYVKAGDNVKQYQKIGEVSGNYMHFETYLDNILLNPLLIYGQYGVNQYNTWVQNNPGKVVKVLDLSKVKDAYNKEKSYEYGFYNELPKEKTNTDFEVPEGSNKVEFPDEYERPDPGILPVE